MIVSGRKMDPEPIQDILMSLEMTNETMNDIGKLRIQEDKKIISENGFSYDIMNCKADSTNE